MEDTKHVIISEGNYTLTPKKDQLLEWIRQWGGSTSEAVLEPEVKIFTMPDISGCIGYRLSHGCAIVLGEPICAPNDVAMLTKSLHQFMDKQNIRIVYLVVSQGFAKWALQNVCGALLEFGQEFTINPMSDPRKMTGKHAWKLRNKIKQVTNAGVTVHEYLENDIGLEQSIEEVGKTWLKGRLGHQFHIGNILLFNNRLGKRWFYAKGADKLVGVVVVNQFKGDKGWFLNNLMETPDAPHGTSELLVVSVLEKLAKERCSFVSLCTATNPVPGEIIGLNKFSAGIVRMAFRLATKLGNLDRLSIYWSKFNPQKEPGYVLFSRKSFGIRELIAIKNVSYESKRN